MLCHIYSETGALVMEAACGVRRDGDVEVIPVRAQRPLHTGEALLLVTGGAGRYPARVTQVHHPPTAGNTTGAAVYHLTPVAAA
jgi:hypothetical protein